MDELRGICPNRESILIVFKTVGFERLACGLIERSGLRQQGHHGSMA